MTAAIRIAGKAKDITGIQIRVGGVLKEISEGWIRVGGALKQFYGKLAVKPSKDRAIGRANSATLIKVTSEPVAALPSGTIGQVGYVWTRTDGDPQPWTINNPGEATTTFSTDCDQGDVFEATFICTVTDQAGQVLASDPVTANCANIFYGGGYKGSLPPAPGTYYP